MTVTKNADQTADLTFNVASLSTVTNLSSIINVGASSIAVTMDVKPDTASLKVVQLDQAPATDAATTESSSSNSTTAASASSASESSVATTDATAATQASAANNTATSEPAATTTPAKESNTTTPATDDTTEKAAEPAAFDPAHLVDGTYQVPVSFLKADSDKPSAAAIYFSSMATVTVKDKVAKVTLHVKMGASMITAFSLGGGSSTPSNETTTTKDLTFDVNSNYTDAIVPATMTISVPMLNMNRKETARVKFGQALYVPTFDPAHLVDGTYQVPVAILKSGKDEPSLSASFFAQTATVTVVGKTVTVTLHVIKNASMITDFSLGDLKNKATFSNQTKDTEDLTFDVNTNFKDAVVSATIPGTNSGIPQPADVKFGQALSVGTTDPSDPGTGTTKPDQPTVTKPDASNKPAANTSVNLNHLVDGTYKLNAPIMQEGLETESIAQQFIDQTAQLIVSNNGRTLKVVFHVNKSLQNIKGMTLDKQAAQITNRHGDTADFVFSVTKATLAGVGQLHFDLTNDGTDFSEEAYVVFNLNHYSLDSLKQQTKSTLNTVASGNNLLDANKQVQYVPYKVFNESRSALSTANNYYTHTAKVVKDATGYKVYLTVQAPTGYVKFQPMTINNGGYSDLSQSSTAGNDVWSYAFHITSATGLDQPVPATIDMTVPIAGISQQQFEIWLVFGQAQSGGTDYLTPTTTAQALPVTTIALAQSATTAAKKTTLKAVPAVKKAAAKSATAAPAANSSMAEKLAKIKDYPFMAEIAGFSVAAIAIIGFAIFKRLH